VFKDIYIIQIDYANLIVNFKYIYIYTDLYMVIFGIGLGLAIWKTINSKPLSLNVSFEKEII